MNSTESNEPHVHGPDCNHGTSEEKVTATPDNELAALLLALLNDIRTLLTQKAADENYNPEADEFLIVRQEAITRFLEKMSPEQTHVLAMDKELGALRTLLSTLLVRANDTLILKGKDRVKYFRLCGQHGRQPLIEVEEFGRASNGDLKIELLWEPRVRAPQKTADFPLHRLITALDQIEEPVARDIDLLRTWTPEQKQEVLIYAMEQRLIREGGSLETPMPRPHAPGFNDHLEAIATQPVT